MNYIHSIDSLTAFESRSLLHLDFVRMSGLFGQILINFMWFIDYLTVQQTYGFRLPKVGDHGVLRYDYANGETLSDSPSPLRHTGSYSSQLMIRCDGSRITVSGNPSRFDRSDNLFGFTSIADCIAVYNQTLTKLGLPPFTKATKIDYLQSDDGAKSHLVSDGALFDRIDLGNL